MMTDPVTTSNSHSDVEDDELFFFQDVVGQAPATVESATGADAAAPGKVKKAAWVDEDDENEAIDLTQVNRLKKLRTAADEAVVSGAELSRRLAEHHSAKHRSAPGSANVPSWALPPSVRKEMRKDRAERKRKRQMEEAVSALVSGTRASSKTTDVLSPAGPLFDDRLSESDDDEDDVDSYDPEDDDAFALLRSTGTITALGHTGPLAKERLGVARLPKLPYAHTSVVSSVAFHPTANVLATAGLDHTLRLAQINGRDNPVLSRVHFADLPIHQMALHPNGERALLTGRRPHAYEYHLETGTITRIPPIHAGSASGEPLPGLNRMAQSPSGKFTAFVGGSGSIVIVDDAAKQWVCTLKMNGSCKSIAWATDNSLVSIGGDGMVYVWDVAARRCVSKWQDVGGFKNAAIAVAPGSNYVATGAYSGIVNVYKTEASDLDQQWHANAGLATADYGSKKGLLTPDTAPLSSMGLAKAISNLTTPIYGLGFNHDAQVLGMFSRAKKDQFKLVHLPSCHVFANWPTMHTPLSYVQCFAFSPNSGMVAIGNDKGRVLLYKLEHFPHY